MYVLFFHKVEANIIIIRKKLFVSKENCFTFVMISYYGLFQAEAAERWPLFMSDLGITDNRFKKLFFVKFFGIFKKFCVYSVGYQPTITPPALWGNENTRQTNL